MSIASNLGSAMLWLFMFFVLIAYLMLVFSVVMDLVRDRELGGLAKAVWLVCLIFVPFLTALVYIVVRGQGMQERSAAQVARSKEATDAYIRSVATHSPAEEIATAKSLLDSGVVDHEEYAALKAAALARVTVG